MPPVFLSSRFKDIFVPLLLNVYFCTLWKWTVRSHVNTFPPRWHHLLCPPIATFLFSALINMTAFGAGVENARAVASKRSYSPVSCCLNVTVDR